MAARFEAVLFDLDGVLIDSETIIGQTWHSLLAEHGLSLELNEVSQVSAGKSFEHSLHDFQRLYAWNSPPGLQLELGRRLNIALLKVQAVSGAVQTLEALRRAGIPFAVASNSAPSRLFLKLRAAGLLELVGEHAYDPSRVGGRAKPLPDLYGFAASQLSVRPARCLVVEDSVAGATAGVAAGATVWGLLAGGHIHADSETELRQVGARRVLSTHQELLWLLDIAH